MVRENGQVPHGPTFSAAVITVVGTGAVAVAGFVSTALATRFTLRSSERASNASLAANAAANEATIRAERAHNLWERRTDAYIDVITLVTELGLYRDDIVKLLRSGKPMSDRDGKAYEILDMIKPISARLVAYGSREVRDSFGGFMRHHLNVAEGLAAVGPRGKAEIDAFVDGATMEAVNMAGIALVDLVRAEIQSPSVG
jgi:hypothetical protein